jgi:hypothetical protein
MYFAGLFNTENKNVSLDVAVVDNEKSIIKMAEKISDVLLKFLVLYSSSDFSITIELMKTILLIRLTSQNVATDTLVSPVGTFSHWPAMQYMH